MGNFAIVVEVRPRPGSADRFLQIITENAQASVADEPGCRRFDVARAEDDADRLVLYEVYDDAAAFDAHRATPHFAVFRDQTADMITDGSTFRPDRLAHKIAPVP